MDKRTILFIVLLAISFYVTHLIFPPPKQPVQKTYEEQQTEEININENQITKPIIQQKNRQNFYVIEND